MYTTYRVRKRFQWGGWEYAPRGGCDCGCEGCTGQVGTGCQCRETICRCACGIPAETYAGDIWIVQAGHPRLEVMMANRFASGDASIPPVDELLKEERFKRLLSEPHRERELVHAGPGRPKKQ